MLRKILLLSLLMPLFLIAMPKILIIESTMYSGNIPYLIPEIKELLTLHGKECEIICKKSHDLADELIAAESLSNRFLTWLHLREKPFDFNDMEKILVLSYVHPWGDFNRWFKDIPSEKLIFVGLEPISIVRDCYTNKFLSFFSKVYTFDDDLVDNEKFFKLYFPELLMTLPSLPPFSERKMCVLVATNREVSWPYSLYKERQKASQYLFSHFGSGFELYGEDWEEDFGGYRGFAKDKLETLKNFRFYLCFENTKGSKGYITEKIFHCFATGCIPIYFGANNVEEYIPKECFIDFLNFSSYEELCHYLEEFTEEDYKEKLTHIEHFLHSEKALLFSKENFLQTIAEALF